jgi:adenosine deaminase
MEPHGDAFDRLPKVELHLHLEGALPLPALWELACKYGGDPEVPDMQALEGRFAYRDFPHFLEVWHWKNRFIREYEDFTFLSEAVARDLAGQNIRYAEVFFSPTDFERVGLEVPRIAQAIRTGLDRVPAVTVALVADLVRDTGPVKAARTLAAVSEVRGCGIIGIGIGGSEHAAPPGPFAAVYEEARRRGFHTSAHAGEAAGPESVWGALRALHAERIGHGTRAQEDEVLVDYLAENAIPLEMCPISNLRTGVVASIEEHPVRRFFDRGLRVTVNSDDPKMFGNSLAEEYRLLNGKLGFTMEEIRRLILNAVDSSWAAVERKEQLRREMSSRA